MVTKNFTALRAHGLTVCRGTYTPFQRPLYNAASILEEPNHVFYPQTKQRWDSRDRTTLWWMVTSNSAGVNSGLRGTVKSWCNRRLRRAVIEALEERGFDRDGRVIKGEMGPSHGLRGTLIVHALKPLVTAKFADVKVQVARIVRELVRRSTIGC